MVTWLEIIILAIIEGITEFLPVSSTGHMILAAEWMNLPDSHELEAFIIIIQGGAILAVVTAYRSLIAKWIKGWFHLLPIRLRHTTRAEALAYRQHSLAVALAVVPFGVVGYMNKDLIKSLFTPTGVAIALIIGGVIMIAERAYSQLMTYRERPTEAFGFRDALVIGIGQCLALWPGFSRAAATILAARFAHFSRPASAELSFIIGLPTILGTTAYEVVHLDASMDAQWWLFIGVGTLLAWVIAYLSVKWLIRFLQRYSLAAFGWYRVAFGILILWLMR